MEVCGNEDSILTGYGQVPKAAFGSIVILEFEYAQRQHGATMDRNESTEYGKWRERKRRHEQCEGMNEEYRHSFIQDREIREERKT